jgi:hypothetical protein
VLEPDQRRAEDRALEAAHADRVADKSTLVIAETSNERLDMLNARAQAIRVQEGELGPERIPLRERPYGLHPGDQIVLRAPLTHDELGKVRNGTSADVLYVDVVNERATLRITDGREAQWDKALLDGGQARLAYVSHPFPAQGRTTDTAHLIAGVHARSVHQEGAQTGSR